MTSDLGNRLRQIREDLRLSQTAMAEQVDCSMRAWQGYERGEQVPGSLIISTLCTLGFDANWILTGRGTMRLGEEVPVSMGEIRYRPVSAMADTTVMLPVYKMQASAGGGAVVEEENIHYHIGFQKDWLRDGLRLDPKYLILIEVKGDSMEPTIADGDLLLVNTQEPRISDNAVYVLGVNGDLLVKRVQRKLDGTLVVLSDNPHYLPEEIGPDAADSFRVIGQVVRSLGVVH